MSVNNFRDFAWHVEHRKQAGMRSFGMPALLGVLLCAAWLIAIPGKAETFIKPYPAGIIALCPPDTIEDPIGDLSGIPGWTNPRVDGLRLRCCWNVVQPQSRTYDWSTIDQALSLGNQYGKKIGVSISAGTLTPQWVYDSGATKYRLVDGSGDSMPLPWEAGLHQCIRSALRRQPCSSIRLPDRFYAKLRNVFRKNPARRDQSDCFGDAGRLCQSQ